MSAQPFVSALSICGPAGGGRQQNVHNENKNDFPRNFGDSNFISKRNETYSCEDGAGLQPLRVPKENFPREKWEQRITAVSTIPTTKSSQQAPPESSAKNAKKPTNTPNQKPPFVVGTAPPRNRPTSQKPTVSIPTTREENGAEVADLKRQIGELSQLIRQHVDKKVSKRDFGTDPIVFEENTAEKCTNTDSNFICTKCKKSMEPKKLVPVAPSAEESPEKDETSICSQLESLAMQYLSDDQLADIAMGKDYPFTVSQPPSRKQQHQQRWSDELDQFSPPARQMGMAAMRTTESVMSPSFGDAGGGMTLTRRQCVMTMEQQVSFFGRGSRQSELQSLPFGVSVASQEFMQRHGIMTAERKKEMQKYNGRRMNPQNARYDEP